MEKYRERKKDLHLVFIDLEKAYDSIPRSIVWDIIVWDSIKNRGISRRYLEVIQDMYDRMATNIHTPVGMTEFFPIQVGLHQGSTLSSSIFMVIMEEISKSIWKTVPWCMLFADVIVLVAETKEEANSKL